MSANYANFPMQCEVFTQSLASAVTADFAKSAFSEERASDCRFERKRERERDGGGPHTNKLPTLTPSHPLCSLTLTATFLPSERDVTPADSSIPGINIHHFRFDEKVYAPAKVRSAQTSQSLLFSRNAQIVGLSVSENEKEVGLTQTNSLSSHLLTPNLFAHAHCYFFAERTRCHPADSSIPISPITMSGCSKSKNAQGMK